MDLSHLQLPCGLLCCWIFVIPEVAITLVFLSIFVRTSCTDECLYYMKPMITGLQLSKQLLYVLFIPTFDGFFFKSGAFCTEFNLLPPFFI